MTNRRQAAHSRRVRIQPKGVLQQVADPVAGRIRRIARDGGIVCADAELGELPRIVGCLQNRDCGAAGRAEYRARRVAEDDAEGSVG